MNYPTMARIARAAAVIAALIAAFGATMGFYSMTGSWLVSGLIGVGVASLLGLGWHLTISAAEHSRRNVNRTALVLIGMALVGVAIATSGWTLVTLIGGKSALSQYQVLALEEHELALTTAMNRVTGQSYLIDNVRQHATATGMLGDEEALSGQGPRYRSYTRTKRSLNEAASAMEATVATADGVYSEGLDAISDAQRNVGTEMAFRDALTRVSSAVTTLNAVDISNGVLSIGMVALDGANLPQLTGLTQSLREAAEASKVDPVPVPRYRSISRSEAVLMMPVMGAWVAAIAVDAAPFIFLLLVLLLANEPLLREPADRRRVSDEEIRVDEGNVIGLREAGE